MEKSVFDSDGAARPHAFIREFACAFGLLLIQTPFAGAEQSIYDISENLTRVEIYDEAIRREPNNPTHYLERGRFYFDLQEFARAVADFSKVVELSPKEPLAKNRLCYTKIELGDYLGAIHDCTKAIALDPYYIHAYVNRGIAKKKLGDLDGAIIDNQKAIEIAPLYITAHSNMIGARIDGTAWQLAVEDCDRGINTVDKLLAVAPESIDPIAPLHTFPKVDFSLPVREGAGLLLSHCSRVERELGRFRRALAYASRGVALEPDEAEAYFQRAAAHSALGNHQAAVDDYTNSLKINPLIERGHFNRGLGKHKLGDVDGAYADFAEESILYPDFARSFWWMGYIKDEQGDYHQALDAYGTALEKGLRDENLYLARGRIKWIMQDFDGVKEEVERALTVYPKSRQATRMRHDLTTAVARTSGERAVEELIRKISRARNDERYRVLNEFISGKNDQDALAEADRLIADWKSDFIAHEARLRCLVRMNLDQRVVDGVGEFLKLQEVQANQIVRAYAHVTRGAAVAKLKQYDKAAQDYSLAVKFHPEYQGKFSNAAENSFLYNNTAKKVEHVPWLSRLLIKAISSVGKVQGGA